MPPCAGGKIIKCGEINKGESKDSTMITYQTEKEKHMKLIQIILLSIVAFSILGCSSSQSKAYKAQEKVYNERLELVESYQKCLKDAGDDNVKAEACERYLKASESLK